MIINILTDTLLIFLITYAACDILYHFFDFICTKAFCQSENEIITVLLDKNIHNVEQVIRNAANHAKNSGCEFVVLFDEISEENLCILNKLSPEIPNMYIKQCGSEHIIQIFEDIFSKHKAVHTQAQSKLQAHRRQQ